MADYSSLIYTAAEYKLLLNFNSVAYPLKTIQDFSISAKVDDETIYAVGEENPIAEKTTGTMYSGKLSMQAGELQALLLSQGLSNATQIRGATLGITAIGGLFARIYGTVNIISEDMDVKAKDKQSIISMNWKALSV